MVEAGSKRDLYIVKSEGLGTNQITCDHCTAQAVVAKSRITYTPNPKGQVKHLISFVSIEYKITKPWRGGISSCSHQWTALDRKTIVK